MIFLSQRLNDFHSSCSRSCWETAEQPWNTHFLVQTEKQSFPDQKLSSQQKTSIRAYAHCQWPTLRYFTNFQEIRSSIVKFERFWAWKIYFLLVKLRNVWEQVASGWSILWTSPFSKLPSFKIVRRHAVPPSLWSGFKKKCRHKNNPDKTDFQ